MKMPSKIYVVNHLDPTGPDTVAYHHQDTIDILVKALYDVGPLLLGKPRKVDLGVASMVTAKALAQYHEITGEPVREE